MCEEYSTDNGGYAGGMKMDSELERSEVGKSEIINNFEDSR